MLNTASIFVGSGLRPSAEITWPMNVTSFFLSFSLSLFSLIPFSLQHCRRECSFLLLSATASLRATGAFLTGMFDHVFIYFEMQFLLKLAVADKDVSVSHEDVFGFWRSV